MASHSDPASDIRTALNGVLDPVSGLGLTESGRIEGLSIDPDRIAFQICVPPSLGPRMEEVRRAAERAVRAVAGGRTVRAILTAERERAAAVAPTSNRPSPDLLPQGVRHVIAIASGKGGVGKSTVALNLACALGALGMRVGLLDADIYGPSQPRLTGTQHQKTIDTKDQLRPFQAHGISVLSIGHMVPEETAMIWRGPMVQSALLQMLRDVDWSGCDVLVIDLPPGTGDIHLTLAQRARISGAVIVSTPQDIALIDARKAIAMFRAVSVPILGIVENMSFFCCPACGTQTPIFSHGGAQTEAATQGVPFLGAIPLAPAIRIASDHGTPIASAQALHGDDPYAISFFDIARSVQQILEGQNLKPPPLIRFA